tara:strand:- start:59 stop:547 length:489 start_codon:yes stop_codon:yes gene_type:complete
MEVDGGDGPAFNLSRNMREVQRTLSEYFMDIEEAIAVRIAAIFLAALKPNQLAGYGRLPGADTEEGATVDVFTPEDLWYSEDDEQSFRLHIKPGQPTDYSMEDSDGDVVLIESTESVFPLEPAVPEHWLEYRDNKLRVYRAVVPPEVDGGDGPTAAFVDLCM